MNMSEHPEIAKALADETASQEGSEATLTSYVYGFVVSIFLTITAYLFVVHHMFTKKILIGVAVALALIQFVVQLLFFLNLGKETKPRWKLYVFFFMLMVVLILVFGSLWIMSNLNYHMTPAQINNYMNSQDNL